MTRSILRASTALAVVLALGVTGAVPGAAGAGVAGSGIAGAGNGADRARSTGSDTLILAQGKGKKDEAPGQLKKVEEAADEPQQATEQATEERQTGEAQTGEAQRATEQAAEEAQKEAQKAAEQAELEAEKAEQAKGQAAEEAADRAQQAAEQAGQAADQAADQAAKAAEQSGEDTDQAAKKADQAAQKAAAQAEKADKAAERATSAAEAQGDAATGRSQKARGHSETAQDEKPGKVKKARTEPEEQPAPREDAAAATDSGAKEGDANATASEAVTEPIPEPAPKTAEQPATASDGTVPAETATPSQDQSTASEQGKPEASPSATDEAAATDNGRDENTRRKRREKAGTETEAATTRDASREDSAEAPRKRERPAAAALLDRDDGTQADSAQTGAAQQSDSATQDGTAGEANAAPEPVEVTRETVTEETTRSSDEEATVSHRRRDGDRDRNRDGARDQSADQSGDRDRDQTRDRNRDRNRDRDRDNDDLAKIIGAGAGGLAAGVIIGTLLNDGSQVVDTTGDRVIVQRHGQYYVRKDENEILRRPGSDVRTERFSDGSTRTVVERPDGTRVVTIRDADGYVVYRSRQLPDGREMVLFDDLDTYGRSYGGDSARIVQDRLPRFDPNRARYRDLDYSGARRSDLRDILEAQPVAHLDHGYTLRQVRENVDLRDMMPRLDLDVITFDTGSAAISPVQARKLDELGYAMADFIAENPDEVFLIEGHTDAVGSRVMNLALSDRRAESVALALTEYYDIPPENLFTQGYGEEYLKIDTPYAERANRRATVRRITPLLDRSASRQ